jgi:hypothetical protein
MWTPLFLLLATTVVDVVEGRVKTHFTRFDLNSDGVLDFFEVRWAICTTVTE